MFAQFMPGMEFIPLINLAMAAACFGVVVGASVLISRVLPLGALRPDIASPVRHGIAILLALPIIAMAVMSWAPLTGPDPMSRIAIGMSEADVRRVLGEPHDQLRDIDETTCWVYYTDWSHMFVYNVNFDDNGRVVRQCAD